MKFFIEGERQDSIRMFGVVAGKDFAAKNRIGILVVFWKWSLAIGWEAK